MTARRTSTFPMTAVTVRIEHKEAEVILSAVGACVPLHGYKPIKDIAANEEHTGSKTLTRTITDHSSG